MSLYSVETTTAGFSLQKWPLQTIEAGELLARKLSVAAIDNPTYPESILGGGFQGKDTMPLCLWEAPCGGVGCIDWS
ncbi:MAG: hypothetical protein IPH41_18375 [Sulfuritalea sp.]|nr:hypothetical protein [Sulfuritalea sp.]